MRLFPTRFLLLLPLLPSLVAAVNFTHCLDNFRNDPNATGGVDSRGNPTSPAQAVGLTYETCMNTCGSGSEIFYWREFTLYFSTWLLPWLALISQLPFGSENYKDDLLSVIMSIGSPALACYSLVLTALNARLVYRKANDSRSKHKSDVANALIYLQQVPIELTKDEKLLSMIPVSDRWIRVIGDRLSRRSISSISTATFVGWVFITYLFTLVDSFFSLYIAVGSSPGGQANVTAWLWLLCLVVGWTWVPAFTSRDLKRAVGRANRRALEEADDEPQDYNHTKEEPLTRLLRRKSTQKGSQGTAVDDPPEEHGGTGDSSSPDPNGIVKSIHRRSQGQQDKHSHDRRPIDLERDNIFHPIESHILNRDEHRLAATFNYSRVMRYLTLVDDVLKALDKRALEKDERKRPIFEVSASESAKEPALPPGALKSMFIASIHAIILQSGLAVAASIIQVFTPTIGLGCLSARHIFFGGMSILILFFTIVSTILAHISKVHSERRQTTTNSFLAFAAIALRRVCVLLAFVNATVLIITYCLEFSGVFDTCYCNASVLGRGKNSYVVFIFDGWIGTMRNARIAATIITLASVLPFMTSLWYMSSFPTEIDDL